MKEQFFGKTFLIAILSVFVAHIISFLVLHTGFETIVLIAIFATTFILSVRKPEVGLLIAFTELFTTSHGRLFATDIFGFSFSVRMSIFVAVMLAWLILLLAKRVNLNLNNQMAWPFMALFFTVLFGLINGGARNNLMDVFNDGNGYIYIAYLLPMFSVKWFPSFKHSLLQIVAASAVWVSFFTVFLLYAFSHLPQAVIRALYVFARDTRIGEFTQFDSGIFRIFIQSQIVVVVFLFIMLSALIYLWSEKRNRLLIFLSLAMCVSTLLISLSRSFYVGIIAGVAVFAVLLIISRIKDDEFFKIKVIANKFAILLLAVLFSFSFLTFVLVIPIPPGTGVRGFSSIFTNRVSNLTEGAISSRWNLLPVMLEHIKQNPILGTGFGTKLAFKSEDPRVKEMYPDGLWRTYAFEWGWLEIWIKMGVFGVAAFILLFINFLRGFLGATKTHQRWLALGLCSGLIALFATHVFSPYLNHPLGLGLMIFMLPFLDFENFRASQAPQSELNKSVNKKIGINPVTASAIQPIKSIQE